MIVETLFSNIWAIAILAVVPILLFATFRLQRRSRKAAAAAEIVRLSPRFPRGNLALTRWVNCEYRYIVGEMEFFGRCVLPISYFYPSASMAIVLSEQADLPVLIAAGGASVGEEAIEHKLLQGCPTLPVQYLQRNPGVHTALPERKESVGI